MIKRILFALALIGAIAACNSPGASSGASVGASSAPIEASPDLSSPDLSSPSVEPSESPAAS
jgi:hypothetical protein